MTSRERVLTSLNHREPDAVPVDFGSTAVTGIHVSVVAALRDYYGLEKRLVKVHEPYQMLGLVDDDLKEAMGIDTEGVFPRKTIFGFENRGWKSWRCQDGLEVLVPEDFRTTVDENGDILIYPEGDLSAPPSGKMPKGGFFFDTIVRQEPIDEERLNPEDNLEEFGPVTEEDLEYFRREVEAAASKGRAVVANFGGTGFGDIALVPAPFLKHPKGIRDIAEWYISTRTRRDYIHAIFSKQCEYALGNLARIFEVVSNRVDVVFLCGTDFGTQESSFCSRQTFDELWLPYYKRINDWIHANTAWKCFKHSCGSVERFIPPLSRPASISSTPCSVPPRIWSPSISSPPMATGSPSGAAASTPSGHCRSVLQPRSANRCSGAWRCSPRTAASSSTRSITSRQARRWRTSWP